MIIAAPLGAESPTEPVLFEDAFAGVVHVLPWMAGLLSSLLVAYAVARAVQNLMSDYPRKSWASVLMPMALGLVSGTIGVSLLSGSDGSAEEPKKPQEAPEAPKEAPEKAPDSSGPDIEWSTVLTVLTVLGIVAAALVVLALLAAGGIALVRRRRERRSAAARVRAVVDSAREALDAVSSQYAAYQADLSDRIFARPALDDLSEPLTRDFLDAYANATAIVPEKDCDERSLRGLDADRAQEMLEAASAAEKAWSVAAAHARKAGAAGSADERKELNRAASLLEQALDPATSAAHRDNLVTKVTDMLSRMRSRHVPDVASLVTKEVTVRAAIAGNGLLQLQQ